MISKMLCLVCLLLKTKFRPCNCGCTAKPSKERSRLYPLWEWRCGDLVYWSLAGASRTRCLRRTLQKWNMADLPIVPQQWQLRPRKSASKQLTVIRKLLKDATEVIHAGDPDREGQLLVDEVLDYCKLSKTKKKPHNVY